MRGYLDYFNLALHWLCPTAPHLLRRVAAGMDRGGRFYQSEWPLRQGTRGRWRGLYAANVRKTWKYIFSEWFDQSEYQFDSAKIDCEYYLGEDAFIYVPVVKK